MKKKRRLKNICIILLIIVFLMIFLPWLKCGETVYTLFGFYKKAYLEHGLASMAQEDNTVYLLPFFLVFGLLASVCSGVKALLLIRSIDSEILTRIIYGLQLVYIATFFAFGGYLPYPPALLAAICTFAEFMVRRYAQDYELFTKEWEKQRAREKEEQDERKRRLAFPGRYDRDLFGLIWRETRHQKKEVLLIHVGNSILFGAMFLLFALKEEFQKGYGITDALPSQGLNGILLNAVIVVVILYVFFEAVALYNYERNRRARQETLWMLGARSNVQTQIVLMEYGYLILCSLIAGAILGMAGYAAAAVLLNKNFGYQLHYVASVRTYVIVVALFLLISCVTAFLVNDSFKNASHKGNRRRGKFAFTKQRYVVGPAAVGIAVFAYAFLQYMKPKNAENIKIALAGFGGGAILLIFAYGLLQRRKCKDRSENFRQVMDKIPIQSGFFRSISLRAELFLFHAIFLGVLSVAMAGNLAAQEPETLCPYDYVCMAYEEDQDFFEELEQNYDLEMTAYPMTRVTTVQGDATDWIDIFNNYYQKVIWPQGQHIGISESTYKALCKAQKIQPEKLDLKEDEIHIVYQQDISVKAHPLDWYMDRETPYIRIGQPLRWYHFTEREKCYPPRKVAGEERAILTGSFQGGMQEDIVVFSDAYFDSLSFEEGPTKLYTLNLQNESEEIRKAVEGQLDIFDKKHAEDSSWSRNIRPYYSGQGKIEDINSERILQKIALLLEMLLLILCTGLMQKMKLEFEKKERKKRGQLLSYIGIYRDTYDKLLQRELRQAFYTPLLWGYAVAAVIAVTTCYLRRMDASESMSFFTYLAGIWCIYLLIQWLLVRQNRRMMRQETD